MGTSGAPPHVSPFPVRITTTGMLWSPIRHFIHQHKLGHRFHFRCGTGQGCPVLQSGGFHSTRRSGQETPFHKLLVEMTRPYKWNLCLTRCRFLRTTFYVLTSSTFHVPPLLFLHSPRSPLHSVVPLSAILRTPASANLLFVKYGTGRRGNPP